MCPERMGLLQWVASTRSMALLDEAAAPHSKYFVSKNEENLGLWWKLAVLIVSIAPALADYI